MGVMRAPALSNEWGIWRGFESNTSASDSSRVFILMVKARLNIPVGLYRNFFKIRGYLNPGLTLDLV